MHLPGCFTLVEWCDASCVCRMNFCLYSGIVEKTLWDTLCCAVQFCWSVLTNVYCGRAPKHSQPHPTVGHYWISSQWPILKTEKDIVLFKFSCRIRRYFPCSKQRHVFFTQKICISCPRSGSFPQTSTQSLRYSSMPKKHRLAPQLHHRLRQPWNM